jgi:transcriptional regulator of acetoin/glycerol metabolism
MAATHMENGLLAHQMQEQWVLAVHPRSEFLGTLSAGLLAFDSDGQLCAANTRARQLLQGLQVEAGTPFDALFDEPFGLVVARLHRGAETRLRDALGSTLVARTVSRPVSNRRAEPVGTAVRPGQNPVGLKHSALAGIVAQDAAVRDAFRLAEAAVAMKAPILIQGETGTGKEVLARHAHQCSGRQGAFVPVNCGALPDELFEAELFGYAGGAYSGARREGSPGLITSADGGTLLLDEIRELPLPLQAALLRFLDDGLVRPVGGTTTHRVDVQLLAATNAALEDEVAARRFRADLLYRLNTVRVDMPPLRQRQDFAAAVHCVLSMLDPRATIEDIAVERLQAYAWPGNFRELRSVLTRALLASEERHLRIGSIERQLPTVLRAGSSTLQQLASETVFREYERTGHSVSQTSRNLCVSRTTVYRHLGGRRAR